MKGEIFNVQASWNGKVRGQQRRELESPRKSGGGKVKSHRVSIAAMDRGLQKGPEKRKKKRSQEKKKKKKKEEKKRGRKKKKKRKDYTGLFEVPHLLTEKGTLREERGGIEHQRNPELITKRPALARGGGKILRKSKRTNQTFQVEGSKLGVFAPPLSARLAGGAKGGTKQRQRACKIVGLQLPNRGGKTRKFANDRKKRQGRRKPCRAKCLLQ